MEHNPLLIKKIIIFIYSFVHILFCKFYQIVHLGMSSFYKKHLQYLIVIIYYIFFFLDTLIPVLLSMIHYSLSLSSLSLFSFFKIYHLNLICLYVSWSYLFYHYFFSSMVIFLVNLMGWKKKFVNKYWIIFFLIM